MASSPTRRKRSCVAWLSTPPARRVPSPTTRCSVSELTDDDVARVVAAHAHPPRHRAAAITALAGGDRARRDGQGWNGGPREQCPEDHNGLDRTLHSEAPFPHSDS